MSLDKHNADPNLSAFESELAGLRPQPSRINRDRLLFEAGRKAEQSRTRRVRAYSRRCSMSPGGPEDVEACGP